ncbi:Glycine cleavage system H protein [Hyphomicrobium sp. 1Nfss2.1]|uniref:glycine cleavage system protein H n=1 Tax=Hyphomicrobium sp. 1Nfss2.1 TaxID=3413936 RepID=UPI003C7EB0D2
MSSNVPDELFYHRDHLWVRACAQADEVDIGISDFAQKQLGTVMFVELPSVGEALIVGAVFGSVESFKVVSDLIAPVTGEVLEVNAGLRGAAGLVNDDCYGAGWLARIRLRDAGQLAELLSGDAYRSHVGL